MGATVYRSRVAFKDDSAQTLVICCSSNAYLPYTEEFIASHLHLSPGSFDLLAVPGGAQLLLATEYLPKFAWVGQRWLKFFAERQQIRRIVVIAHDDCAWYATEHAVPAFLHSVVGVPHGDRQRTDLGRVAAALRELHPAATVEAYFAAKGSDGAVEFSREA
jgi:hypothetical protein